MHFFNPALVMKCVEVVRHETTSDATVETTMELARRLGKEPVLINREIPGFVANRLMGAVRREALFLADSGIASIEDIDTTARTALGHPMGPFALMDLVGLDVVNFIDQATYAETGADRGRPEPADCRAGCRGQAGPQVRCRVSTTTSRLDLRRPPRAGPRGGSGVRRSFRP